MPQKSSDVVEFSIFIENRCAWLLLFLFIFAFGAIVLNSLLLAIGKMVREKDERGIDTDLQRKINTDKKEILKKVAGSSDTDVNQEIQTDNGATGPGQLTGKKICLITLTLMNNSVKFTAILCSMPQSSIKLLRRWLNLDYFYMSFIYPAMFFFSRWLRHCSYLKDEWIWNSLTVWTGWIALIVWAFDILENVFVTRLINNVLVETELCEKKSIPNNVFMRIFSWAKWSCVLIYLVLILSMTLINVSRWFHLRS